LIFQLKIFAMSKTTAATTATATTALPTRLITLITLLINSNASAAVSANVCPQLASHLTSINVFDGAVEELASLIPDASNEHQGYWMLEYVYAAGRFVTVRCIYADGHTVDVKLPNKINRCSFTINTKKVLTLKCR
jgi:hypothetical protein